MNVSSVKRSIEDKFVVWEYERLCILGLIGRLETPLERLNEYELNIEFAPVKKEFANGRTRDFLAGFCFDPLVDVTIVKTQNDSSIVTYSLDKKRSKKLVDELVQKSGFIPYEPEENFIEVIEYDIELLETETYEICKKISQLANMSFENTFGMIRYANFLHRYKGFSMHDSLEEASKKFNL